MKKELKVGDWCFSNFELCQVKRISDGRVTEVSTGIISRSGHDLTESCFPLEMKIKRISGSVEYWYKKLHELHHLNLNYPDIVRSLEERWIEMCHAKDDDKAVSAMYENLQSFCRQIIEMANSMKDKRVEGIAIMRH